MIAGPGSMALRDLVGRLELALGRPQSIWQRGLFIPEPPVRLLAWALDAAYRTSLGLGRAPTAGPPLTPPKIDVLCRHRSFSAERARKLLGFTPHVDYPEGLKRSLDWLASEGLLPGKGRAHHHRIGRVTYSTLQRISIRGSKVARLPGLTWLLSPFTRMIKFARAGLALLIHYSMRSLAHPELVAPLLMGALWWTRGFAAEARFGLSDSARMPDPDEALFHALGPSATDKTKKGKVVDA